MAKKTTKRILIALSLLILLIPATVFGYIYFKLNGIYNTSDNSPFSNSDYKIEKGIKNILLCGTDGRPGEKTSRADSMMLLTIDGNNKNIRVTSFARDTLVSTKSHGDIKLTETYAYGGINLLTEAIEDNFKIDIQNYAIVDFYSFIDIIETLGGINVDIKENEISELNKFIPETYEWSKDPNKGEIKKIENAGEQHINGYQALAFARIRKGESGGAFERDRRQREIIEGMIEGIKALPITKYPNLIDTLLPHVKTNMKPTEVLSVGTGVLRIGANNITQMEFPIDDEVNSHAARVNGKYVIKFKESSLDILHDFIFKDITPKEVQ
ncbi:MAG: LCP family protein [Clostridium sp.]